MYLVDLCYINLAMSLSVALILLWNNDFLSASLARARASTDHFFCLQTLMKLTTPMVSEFPSLALQSMLSLSLD